MKESAGILPFRRGQNGDVQVYLVHMGGPYWKNKLRSWSIAKGEIEEGEEPLQAALREFREETGHEIDGRVLDLGRIKGSGKTLWVWAVEAEPDPQIHSNTFTIEWPPGSGRVREFPEVDRAGWFSPKEARGILAAYQVPILDRLLERVRRMGEEGRKA